MFANVLLVTVFANVLLATMRMSLINAMSVLRWGMLLWCGVDPIVVITVRIADGGAQGGGRVDVKLSAHGLRLWLRLYYQACCLCSCACASYACGYCSRFVCGCALVRGPS